MSNSNCGAVLLSPIGPIELIQDGIIYNVQQNYDLEWIQMSVRALINLYETTDLPLPWTNIRIGSLLLFLEFVLTYIWETYNLALT